MNFISTRGIYREEVSAAEAIKRGLAPDGGLFMPKSIPALADGELKKIIDMPYTERAAYIIGKFLTDYTYEELLADAEGAYAKEKFGDSPAPVVKIDDATYMLELWHGPTCAFKDMALQIMPRLFVRALRKTGEERKALILVATSGDTGKAALEGYRDVDGTMIQVFYPTDGVSSVQKLQMQTQVGNNVSVLGIKGNFDDAQNGVKRIFSDACMRDALNADGVFLSSANSINWGRLVPQIVYYVSAYCDMVKNGAVSLGDEIDVCVPTGNFGNIFAAYIAKLMGLPIKKFICASNKNNVLTDFLNEGVYDRNRPFHATISPSMDILISSNLERLLYFTAGTAETADCMKKLSEIGRYEVSAETKDAINANFVGYFADENETATTLRKIYESYGYLADTHTSVAFNCAEKYVNDSGDNKPMVVVSTASPYKFAADVYKSVTGKVASDGTAALDELSAFTNTEISYPLRDLDKRTVNFNTVIESDAMLDEVYKFM